MDGGPELVFVDLSWDSVVLLFFVFMYRVLQILSVFMYLHYVNRANHNSLTRFTEGSYSIS